MKTTLCVADRQDEFFTEVARFCDETLPEGSIYVLLYRERSASMPCRHPAVAVPSQPCTTRSTGPRPAIPALTWCSAT